MKKFKKRLIAVLILLICILIYLINPTVNSFVNNLYSKCSNFITSLDLSKLTGLDTITGDGDLVSEDEASKLNGSDIDGSNYTFSASYYPYYEMLNNNEKAVYKQAYANAIEYSKTFVPTETIDTASIINVMSALNYDHPELFYLDNSFQYKYTKNGKIVQIILQFNSTYNNIEEATTAFNRNANTIIENAKKLSNNYEKEKYVYEALISKISYSESSSINQSAYSALVNGKTVCAGYAKAFQYIMTELGIPTYYVVGKASSSNHAWNIVKLEDGYYNVDVTWGDTSPINYTYFNVTDTNFSNHTRTDLSVNLPKCTATTYKYKTTTSSSRSNTNNSSNNTNNSKSNDLNNSDNIDSSNDTNTTNQNNNTETTSENTTDETTEDINDEISMKIPPNKHTKLKQK